MRKTLAFIITVGAVGLGLTPFADAAERERTTQRSRKQRTTAVEGQAGGAQWKRNGTPTRDGNTVVREGQGVYTGPGGKSVATERSGSTTYDPSTRTATSQGQASATGPNGRSYGGSYQKSRTNNGDGTVSQQGSVQSQNGETVVSGASTTARSYTPQTKTGTTDRTGSMTGKNGNSLDYDYNRTSSYDKETHTVDTQSSLSVTGENGKSATATGQRSTTYGQGTRDSQGTQRKPRTKPSPAPSPSPQP